MVNTFLDVTFNLATKNTFLFERIHHSKSTTFRTTHLQSSNSCLKWSTREFQIHPVIMKSSTKLNLSLKQHWRIVDIFHQCLSIIAMLKMLEEIETEKFYGSTHHKAKMQKQILVNQASSSLWGNTFPRATNIIRFST